MIAGQLIVMLYAREPVQPLEVAVTVKLNVPVEVGVPERTPPDERVTPAGNVPVVTL